MQRHDGSRVVWGPQGKGRGIVKQCRSSKGSCKHAPLVGGTLQSVLTQSVLRRVVTLCGHQLCLFSTKSPDPHLLHVDPLDLAILLQSPV